MGLKKLNELLCHAAKRATRQPFFLGAALEDFCAHRGMGETALIRFLECPPECLPKLALCRRPNPDLSTFCSDVHRIANAFGLQADRLVQILREVDTLKALGQTAPETGQEESKGVLLAARDFEASANNAGDNAVHKDP